MEKTAESKRIKTYRIAAAGMCTALICVLSLITIPTGAVPFSLSLFAVFLVGALLTPKYALASTFGYIMIGVIGIPVFSNFSGGIGFLFGVTGGYIISYPVMAFIISFVKIIVKKNTVFILIISMLIALAVCYTIGTVWFSVVTGKGFTAALSICVLPFVWFDLLKIALASSLAVLLEHTPVKKYLF